MTGIFELLGGDTLQQIVNGASQKTGISSQQASSVIETAVPLLMGAFQNSGKEADANGLLSALQSEKHDGSLVNNFGNIFEAKNDEITKDGAGILGHLLGDKQAMFTDAISSKTGVSSANVSQILQTLAPVLMSFLGKKVSDNNISSSNGLNDLLSGFLAGNNNVGSLLTSFLDANKDGNVMDDLAGMLGGKSANKGGLGDLLGGILGGK